MAKPKPTEWCKPGKGAIHGGVSTDTFCDWFKYGLRYVRLPSGHRLTRFSWIDDFLESLEEKNEATQKAEEILESLTKRV